MASSAARSLVDPARLAAARAMLGPAAGGRRLGAYALYTGVDDEELLGHLAKVASGLGLPREGSR